MTGGCRELEFTKGSKTKKDCDKSKPKNPCAENEGEAKTGKEAFGIRDCPKPGEQKSEIDCHESVKNFFDRGNEKKKCGDKGRKEKIHSCEETSKKVKEKNNCHETSETDKCAGSASSSKEESSQCGPCKGDKSACGRLVGSSKKNVSCKDLGKQYVDFSPKKAPSSDKDDTFKLPQPQVMTMKPCLPRVESSKGKKVNFSCISRGIGCAQLERPMMAEFFCIDARNERMNECIKQFVNADPSQIRLNCAQFARKRMHTASCVPSGVLCGYPPERPALPGRPGFLPPKYRQIMRR